jgi:hypothetical protein
MHCVRCMASGPKPNIEPSRVQSCSSFTTILSLCTTNLTYLPFSPLTPQKFRTCHPRPRVVFGQLNRESKLTPCRLIFRVRSPHFSFLTTPPTSVALQETQTSLPPQVFDHYTLCAPLSNVPEELASSYRHISSSSAVLEVYHEFQSSGQRNVSIPQLSCCKPLPAHCSQHNGTPRLTSATPSKSLKNGLTLLTTITLNCSRHPKRRERSCMRC